MSLRWFEEACNAIRTTVGLEGNMYNQAVLGLPLLGALVSVLKFSTHADYSALYRPQVHYSAPRGFMNDPNGLHYDPEKGLYHYYYQLNPTGLEAGNQNWGHATSPDLYHWANHDIAINPDNASSLIFSGSAVIDSENTSGFFSERGGGVVAIYTAHSPEIEDQHIAYSKDGGYSFTKYKGNPVIGSTSADFRDPKVTWHAESRKWVMVVSYAKDYKIGIYTSPNLKDWTPASNFSQEGLPGEQFECPNLVRFSVDKNVTKDVLFISINPGAPLGGSGTYYLVGNFNGTHFEPDSKKYTWLDFAKDNYAVQFFDGQDGTKPVSISWASNWDYTNEVPTDEDGWRGAASIPHEHTLVKDGGEWVVTSTPYKGLLPVMDKELTKTSVRAARSEVSIDFSDVKSNAVYFDVVIDGLPSGYATGEVSFNITSSKSEDYLDGALNLGNSTFWMNRAGTRGFTTKNNGDFIGSFSTSVSWSKSGRINYSAVFDRSVFETFLQNGTQTGTMVFYPDKPLDTLTFKTSGFAEDATVGIEVWSLKSGWTSSKRH
ncbi:hypothetical protein KEM54_000311 [Ascosphaera aggregata]|nr:hypothetical protein KEM54_000311 [Ascosphaera aggregata]